AASTPQGRGQNDHPGHTRSEGGGIRHADDSSGERRIAEWQQRMTAAGFIVKNALRNKRRALLSVSSVAASLFLLVTLQVALRELTLPPPSAGAELRVAVRN